MKQPIIFVKLSEKQISEAKQVNNPRSRITHAVLCGNHGQLFGTEKWCKKYFLAWSEIFPNLFDKVLEVDNFEIKEFKSTFDLVIKLIEADDEIKNRRKKRTST